MKKLAVVIISCLMLLCSCSTVATYNNQETVNVNYNNISNHCDFWMTTDSICYLDHSLIQTYYMVDRHSKTKIDANNGYGFGKIQRYEDKIYILEESDYIDEYNSSFELKCYDIHSKEIKMICSVKNCDNFLVLNESVYYLEYSWNNGIRTLSLNKFSFNSTEHTQIENNVLSFGVMDNSLYYITYEKDKLSILKYVSKTEESLICGNFPLERFNAEDNNSFKASYTPHCVLVSFIDYENEASSVYKYTFEEKALNSMTMEGYIDSFASYNANSYFIVSSPNSDNNKLYILDNEKNAINEIAKIRGEGSLFVGSDEGVYVSRNADAKITYYSNDGNSQDIYQF